MLFIVVTKVAGIGYEVRDGIEDESHLRIKYLGRLKIIGKNRFNRDFNIRNTVGPTV